MRFLRANIISVAIALVSVALLLAVVVLVLVSNTAQSNCRQLEKLKGAISLVVEQNVKTLGVKGSAGYAYYHSHPDELAAAKAAGAQQLKVFKPRAC